MFCEWAPLFLLLKSCVACTITLFLKLFVAKSVKLSSVVVVSSVGLVSSTCVSVPPVWVAAISLICTLVRLAFLLLMATDIGWRELGKYELSIGVAELVSLLACYWV